jgi:hypothetical protein
LPCIEEEAFTPSSPRHHALKNLCQNLCLTLQQEEHSWENIEIAKKLLNDMQDNHAQ